MFFVCSNAAIRAKYGAAATAVLGKIHRLGTAVDVSGLTPEAIQARIGALKAGPVCLVGGYDIVAPFIRPNPTHGSGDDDAEIPTDAPYGAVPSKPEEEFAPSRAVSRIPDSARADAAEMLALLDHQLAAPSLKTPAGTFEQAASEFAGPLKFVRKAIPKASGSEKLSPPGTVKQAGLAAALTGKGRVHILLHGANFDPDWASLWGHAGRANSPFIEALSAQLIDLCDLRGAVVTFSSCYAAMLDAAPALAGQRNSSNQVAIACLCHGAKVVFASTRSNWIDMQAPFSGFGPGLMAEVWRQLGAGAAAAEALRLAKATYLKAALSGPKDDQPYALKTVLQAQCYGHPGAKL